jgi:cytochrome c553
MLAHTWAGCHEDGGRGQDEENPRLADQWVGYMRYMLEQCREIGKPCRPRKVGARLMHLRDGELRALAHYYASEK